MNKSRTNIVDIIENSLDFSCMTLSSSSNYSLLIILCFRQGSICVLCPSPKMNILNIYFQTNTRQRMSANNNMKRKMHLSLLGNIGCGKSSVLNKIKGYQDMAVRDEPMDKWENIGGQNLLKMYYDDPKKWAFVFQTQVLLTLG